MKRALMGIIFALGTMACTSASVAEPPGAPSLSSEGHAAIDALLEQAIAERGIPKVVAMLANRDGVLYEGAFGKQDVAADVDLALDSIFNLASMTKPVTSVAVLMLAEDGRFHLDDPVSRYLPALADRRVVTSIDERGGTYETVPAERDITVRQLLTHTSGLAYNFSNRTAQTLIDITGEPLSNLPLVDHPGTRWHYSGSTAVLGDLVAEVSGMPLDVFLRDRIFAPLGMDDTAYVVPAHKRDRVVTVHRVVSGDLVEAPVPETVQSPVRGDGGLYGTAADYIRFLRMLLNNGELDGARLLSEASVRAMLASQTGAIVVDTQRSTNPATSSDFPLGAGRDTFGLGFQITSTDAGNPNLRAPGSYSWGGLFNTHFWGDPRREIVAVILMQQLPFYGPDVMAVYQDFEEAVNLALE